jgi:hypothetical protein
MPTDYLRVGLEPFGGLRRMDRPRKHCRTVKGG